MVALQFSQKKNAQGEMYLWLSLLSFIFRNNCQSSNYADVLNVISALGPSVTCAIKGLSDGSLLNQIGL